MPACNNGYVDRIDLRYAEVLLNYAEAVVEGEFADNYTDAGNALNEVRTQEGRSLPRTWLNRHYYRSIPGTGTSGLEHYPQYKSLFYLLLLLNDMHTCKVITQITTLSQKKEVILQ